MSGGRVIYGVGPVRELLSARPGTVDQLLVVESRAPAPPGGPRDRRGGGPGPGRDRDRDPVAELVELARARGIRVNVGRREELDALAGGGARHQGVIALAGEYRYAEVADLLAAAEARGETPLLVALDSVQDPHNLGAIIRSAYMLGAHGVILPRDRASQVNATVAKAAAGATEHIGVAQVVNLVRALEELKQGGVWLAAVAAGGGARPLAELDASIPLCLIVGAEGSGIRPLVARTCDLRVEIPMAGSGVGSLNASVAAGIALYEVVRQRQSA